MRTSVAFHLLSVSTLLVAFFVQSGSPIIKMIVFGAEDILYTIDLHDAKVKQVNVSNFTTLDIEPNKKGKLWPSLHSGVSEDMSIGIDVDSLAVIHVVFGAYSGDSKDDADKLAFSKGFDYYFTSENCISPGRADGTDKKAFISNGIYNPNALAFDVSNEMLYWAGTDANNHGIIEAVSPDGLDRTVIFNRAGYHPFSLDVHEGFIYWSDWAKNAILRIRKNDGGGEEVLVDGVDKPVGLKILHPWVGLSGTNPCKNNNGGCVHLPLLSKQKCFCKEEFTHHSSEMNKKRKTGGNKILQGERAVKPSDPSAPPVMILLFTIIMILLAIFHGLSKKYSEDSSVKRPVYVFVTNVVDQHGGVTIVGDDSKVSYHYPPQN